MDRKRRIAVLFVLLLLAWPARARGQAEPAGTAGPVILTDDREEYPLGLHMEFLEDPGGELTIEDVTSPAYASRFLSSRQEVPNFGFTDSAYWVRLRVDNQRQLPEDWVLALEFPSLHYVDLYTPGPDGSGYTVRQTGAMRPLETRDISNPRVVFQISLPGGSEQTLYLRVKSGASMTLGATLWAPAAFQAAMQRDQVWHGLFLGLMLGLLFYNLFLLFSLWDTTYLYLVLVLAGTILFDATYTAYLETYVVPGLYHLRPFYQPLFFALMIASVAMFAAAFLEAKTQSPGLHRLFLAILGVWGGLALLTPFTTYRTLASLMIPWAIVTLLAVLAGGLHAARRKFRPARLFLVAWLVLAILFSMTILARLDALPSTPSTENAFRVGAAWMAVCWSLALADRINLLRADVEEANRSLRNSEHRLSEILEGLPLGVVVYGPDSRPTYVNARVTEILGNPARGIAPNLSAGRTLAQAMRYFTFRRTGSDEAYALEAFPVYRALRGEPAATDDVEADLVDRRVPLEMWASPVKDDRGRVESAVVAFQDITRRKEAEAELTGYRKHLEAMVAKRTAELSATNDQLNLEVAQRKVLEEALQQRIAWLSALNEVQPTVNGAADLAQAFRALSTKLLPLLGAKAIFLMRWDDPGTQSNLVCTLQGDRAVTILENFAPLFEKGSPVRMELERGEMVTVLAGEADTLPVAAEACMREAGLQSFVLIPLSMRQVVAGVLGVGMAEVVEDFNEAQADLVREIASDLIDLHENARLLDQGHALIAAEERNRLARDLHDSVTQVLFSASLVAEVLPQIWRRDAQKALEGIEDLRRLTRSALAEMRTMLLELRPAAVFRTPLAELLAQLTEAVTGRVELSSELFLEQVPPLPAEVQTGFYRIAQEALNNVVKHAQARQVSVTLSARPLAPGPDEQKRHRVKLVIEDDGVGFRPGEDRPQHMGTGIMRERASAMQATLSLASAPGHGTRVTLVWEPPA